MSVFLVGIFSLSASAADKGLLDKLGSITTVGDLGNVIHVKLIAGQNIFLNAQLFTGPNALVPHPELYPDDQFVVFVRPGEGVNELLCIKHSGIDYLPLGALRNAMSPTVDGRILGPILVFDREEDTEKLLKLRYIYIPPAFSVSTGPTIVPELGPDQKVYGVENFFLKNGVNFNPAPQIAVDMQLQKPEVFDNVCPDGLNQEDLGT